MAATAGADARRRARSRRSRSSTKARWCSSRRRRTCRRSSCRSRPCRARRRALASRSRRRAGSPAAPSFGASVLGQPLERALVAPAGASARPRRSAAVCGSRSRRRRSLSASACQRPAACGREQPVEQRVDRGAAVDRLVAQQHHVAAGVRARARRLGVGRLAPPIWRAPAMLRSSLKIAPSKPSSPRRISFSQRAEKPAGRASTFG